MENRSKINNQLKILNKISKSVDKDALQRKFFYRINLSNRVPNIFQIMENGLSTQDEFEEVDNIIKKSQNHQNMLKNKKIECMKSMILNHKKIPEKWIMKMDYKSLLNEVMEDPIVLSYAIFSKDYHKKNSPHFEVNEEEVNKILKSENNVKRFISYINPHKKYISESLDKNNHKKRYGKSTQKINKKNNYKQNSYLKTEESRNSDLPNIFVNNKIMKNNGKENEKNETFMMTSLYYDENNLITDNKDKDAKNIQKNYIELPNIKII